MVTLILMGASLPLVYNGSRRAIESMFNTPRVWVPRTFPARQEFIHFTAQFQAPQTILISWPGCTVDDDRLDDFVEAMRASVHSGAENNGEHQYFTRVTSGYTLLRQLTSDPLNLSRDEAIERLRGTLVGPDDRTSCGAVSVTPRAAREREKTLALILQTLDRSVGLRREAYRLAGSPLDGLAIDRESIRSIHRYMIPSAFLSFVLCWICLRSLWLTLPVMAAAVFGQGVVVSLIHYAGITMNAILIVLPSLVFVLTVSAGVHLVNYYYEARQNNTERATGRALSRGWAPCLVAAITTAIGVGSLLVSAVIPVRHFGTLGAFGVMGTFGLLLLLLPGAMQSWTWILGRWKRRESPSVQRADEGVVDRLWRRLAARISRSHFTIATGCIAMLLVAAVGLTWIQTSVNAVSLLHPEDPHMQDLRWFQKNIGPLIPVEVILHMDRDDSRDLTQRLTLVRQVEQKLRGIRHVGGSMSAATFAPRIARGGSVRATAVRAILRSRLKDRLPSFEAAHYLSQGEDRQSWRISGRVESSDKIDYGRFLHAIRREIEPIVDEYRNPQREIRVTYTGVTPVVYEIQRELLNDLFHSYLTAMALVTVVMMLVLRSVAGGLVAMIPNVFPATVVLGLMGWTGTAVDIGSVMTASVALGIAVDGTIHFLNWFRHGVQQGASSEEAIAQAYRHCGRALVQTTLIVAVGLAVYVNSGFIPAQRFSLMILLLLIGALVGDLVLLPSLLRGRLGKLFAPPCSGAGLRPSGARRGGAS
ncbi:MAG: efflux RND transporter permease subunit [Planctomycetota bacterium]